MPPDIVGLLTLQERDLRLQELRKELERIPKEQDLARERLATHQQAVDDAKAALQENGVAIKGVELDVGTRKESITRLKQQQFETRKNEEYQALGVKVSHYSDEIDGLETRELELMESGDQLRGTLTEAEAAYSTTKGGVDEEISILQKRADEFSREAQTLEEERQQLLVGMDESLVSIYDRLLKLRGAPVVVQITGERQCLGCHVKATPATMVRVQAGKELVNCENCGRILYPQ
ncbi:MAG: C4-type zinc ribbon domain-containing protein [Roseibacillus sp.]|nr:C4-type zinc ribbon domain-containing protein [Roseibacillus sp.]